MRMRCLRGLWLAALLGVSSLGAAGKDALLADAVQRGDRQAVLSLLKTQADVNAPQSDGATALHWAAYLDDADTTAAADQSRSPRRYRQQLRHHSAGAGRGNGNAAVIDRLLKGGADPNGAVRAGETPLMLAARTGNVDAVKVLLARRRTVDAKETWNGQTALMWAAAAGHGPCRAGADRSPAPISTRSSNSGATRCCLRRGEATSTRFARWWRREPMSKARDRTARRRCWSR